MSTIWLELFGVLFLITLVGFFSACEVAVLSTRKSRMKELAEQGNRNASIILAFQSNPDRFLATVHVGNIFSLVLASGLGGVIGFTHIAPALAESGSAWISQASGWLALAVVVCMLGFLVVVFGELVPKSLTLRSAESVALRLAPTFSVLAAVLHLPARFLTFASNIVLAPFKDRTTFTESRISEEEFKLMLEEGTKTGVIDKTEHELIESIFEFTDTTAKEVMIPRPDIVAINVDASRDSILRVVLEEGYSRLPVYRGTIDSIIGIVYTKDFLGLLEYRNVMVLQDIIRPAYFVPETKKISQLMRELQQQRIHMAVVMDEFGGTEGIVTMEDILEEIVGEIHDEYDEDLREIEQAADGSTLVPGRMAVTELNERFGVELPEGADYDTLSGFLNTIAGRIPEVGEEIVYGLLSFTILKKSQRRIRLVRIRRGSRIAGA